MVNGTRFEMLGPLLLIWCIDPLRDFNAVSFPERAHNGKLCNTLRGYQIRTLICIPFDSSIPVAPH